MRHGLPYQSLGAAIGTKCSDGFRILKKMAIGILGKERRNLSEILHEGKHSEIKTFAAARTSRDSVTGLARTLGAMLAHKQPAILKARDGGVRSQSAGPAWTISWARLAVGGCGVRQRGFRC